MIARNLSYLILILLPSFGFCQHLITGRVIDSETKEPVRDANVAIDGTDVQTTTNYLGYFQLNADSSMKLQIRHDGYETGSVNVPYVQAFQILLSKDTVAIAEFYSFISSHLRYPPGARREKTQGLVYVAFDVDSLKHIYNIRIIEEIGNDCGHAVVDLIKQLPDDFTLPSKEGTLILPVLFALESSVKHFKREKFEAVGANVNLPNGELLHEIVILGMGVTR